MRRNHLIGIGLFLAISLSWALLYSPNPHPSDEALIEYFQKHQLDFDRLVSMANEDSGVRAIYPDQVMLEGYKIWPKGTEEGFTKQRWSEYQRLFAKLEEYDIAGFSKDSNMIQISASIGVSDLDDYESIVITKGYAYSLKEPSALVGSLDNMGFNSRGTYYKKIGGHWYLYHDWGISKPE
jgi:hypothetical protein